jgi:hypothetical protein
MDMAISPNGNYVVVMLSNKTLSKSRQGNYLWYYHAPSCNTYFTMVQRPYEHVNNVHCNDTHAWITSTGSNEGLYKLDDGERENSYMILS